MSEMDHLIRTAELFKVLGNAARVGVLLTLRDGEMPVGRIAEASNLAQPVVSQHLKALRSVGLVTCCRHGKEVRYSISDQQVLHVVEDALAHTAENLAGAQH
ncbi:metalloregulator ArsR/SmtB family transcription factor [Helcobacillus sp. ACRRO]|uniref:ArsR/SmtB family transcription factor n=1 Tax=Helcobacillus sp. ACRRO TaxID=2918202 RepID=UPI001EF726CD|nr:metalloregulator ArsR/SmtB family transcription factor [Helcobacillus sp. ACRRO]MCG7427867.1 metalloregulator ArsR/SmtB family transcription factor [Helcobacillus sp. ACRRO]